MLRLLPLAVLLAIALAPATTASAQGSGTFFECSDFTPDSVRDACDRAVPIECRGPEAPSDFDACLRDNGTTPEAVDAAITAALRAAGIPVGGVDTGLGGLAAAEGEGGGPLYALLSAAAALLGLGAVVRARRLASSR